jgi:ferrous iron transport protein B
MASKVVILVGHPNVGKSVIFNYLTGARVHVANYPGTTVTISRGQLIWSGVNLQIIDTPGLYSLLPVTGEERVTRDLLWRTKPHLVVHVIDAKNLQRMLPLTLQLLETGLPLLLNLNIMDEARQLGLTFNLDLLERSLGIPVVATTSITGEGMVTLRQKVITHVS